MRATAAAVALALTLSTGCASGQHPISKTQGAIIAVAGVAFIGLMVYLSTRPSDCTDPAGRDCQDMPPTGVR